MIITNRQEFEEALASFTRILTVDTETSGVKLWMGDHIAGIGVYTENDQSYYFPFRHKNSKGFKLIKDSVTRDLPLQEGNLPIEWLPELLIAIRKADVLIGHNLKFEMTGFFQEDNRGPEGQILIDTIVMSRLRFCGKYDELDLETVVTKVLMAKAKDSKDEFVAWKNKFVGYLKSRGIYPHYDCGDIDIVGQYCEDDCKWTYKLYKALAAYISRTEQMDLFATETSVLKLVLELEIEGMFYDKDYCEHKIPMLNHRLDQLAKAIYDCFGYIFDINSTHQLKKAFNSIGIKSSAMTEKGNEKWNLEVLLNIEHPVAKLVLQYRESYKMLNTYFIPYSKWGESRIHPSYKTWGAGTGRMSCTNPNLQNVMTKPIDVAGEKVDPKVAEIMKTVSSSSSVSSRWIARITKFEEKDSTVAVKRLFVAPKDYNLITADYHQQEMRFFAHYINDAVILEKLETDGFDFHSMVAMEVWNVLEDDANWKFYRSIAKAVNFGIIYGIGIQKLSGQIGKSMEETKEYKEMYFKRLPTALTFMNNVRNKIKQQGYITNFFGRRYMISSDKAYIGVNYLCQGGGADLIKNRMVALDEFFKTNKLKTKMCGQVHDELLFYVHKDEMNILPNIKEIMEKKILRCRTPIDFSRANPSWSEKLSLCSKCYGDKTEVEDNKWKCLKCN